jgi:uncharacterized protein
MKVEVPVPPAADLYDRIREQLDLISAVDHHAHLMCADDGAFVLGDDAAPLAELILESSEPERAREHVRQHPSYGRAVRDLAELLGVERDEGAVVRARSQRGHASYVKLLMVESRLEAIYVDDGLRFPGLMSMPEQEELTGIPVRRVARVEILVQDAAHDWPSFDVLRDRFRAELTQAVSAGLIGLKTIAAFRCGLDLPEADETAARAGYDRWRATNSPRLIDSHVISYFLDEALALTAHPRLPLQVHAGLVGTDVDLRAGDPAALRSWLNRPAHQGVPVVVLHCYPYLREASWLASLYPDVYLDLSMAMQWVGSHRGAAMILETLDVAPVSKLLFATDGFRVPELFYLGARWWRDSLAEALAGLVDRGYVTEVTALEYAELVLRGNAHRIYPA